MDPKADVLIVTVTKGESLAVLSAFEKETGQRAPLFQSGIAPTGIWERWAEHEFFSLVPR